MDAVGSRPVDERLVAPVGVRLDLVLFLSVFGGGAAAAGRGWGPALGVEVLRSSSNRVGAVMQCAEAAQHKRCSQPPPHRT